MCSGQEAVSYCDEAASTVALAGSVIDAKSLTDSASGRVVVAQLCCRDRDLSPTSHQAVAVGELARNGMNIVLNSFLKFLISVCTFLEIRHWVWETEDGFLSAEPFLL